MRAQAWKVYLQPFLDSGAYSGVWIDVTDDVELDSMNTIDQSLDNTDYNLGVYKTADFQITFRNDNGKYSDVGQPESIFKYTRTNTLFKLTWRGDSKPPTCGFSVAGEQGLCPEVTVLTGLINDSSLTMDLETNELQFDVLGLENVLSNLFPPSFALSPESGSEFNVAIAAPGFFNVTDGFSSSSGMGALVAGNPISFVNGTLDGSALPGGVTAGTIYYVSGVVPNVIGDLTFYSFNIAASYDDAIAGMNLIAITSVQVENPTILFYTWKSASSFIYSILTQSLSLQPNQMTVEKVLTVDPANIVCGLDFQIDDTSGYLSNPVSLYGVTDLWDMLADLLVTTNSVFYVKNGAIYVQPRAVAEVAPMMFYGQSSRNGVENIQDIQNIASGIARVFNYLSWPDTDTSNPDNAVQNNGSVAFYGQISKSFNQAFIQQNANKISAMNGILEEYAFPKQEFDLYTPLNYTTIQAFLLNPVLVDYPPVYTSDPADFPICGIAVCGEAITPKAIFAFIEMQQNLYKIEGTSIDPQTNLICISMRVA